MYHKICVELSLAGTGPRLPSTAAIVQNPDVIHSILHTTSYIYLVAIASAKGKARIFLAGQGRSSITQQK